MSPQARFLSAVCLAACLGLSPIALGQPATDDTHARPTLAPLALQIARDATRLFLVIR